MRSKQELFSQLIVDVPLGGGSVYESLDNQFDVSTVTIDGEILSRTVTIVSLPPILQLHIQRVQFDREKGQAYKSNAFLKFDKMLYLDRYMETDDQKLLDCREYTKDLRKKIDSLKQARQAYIVPNVRAKKKKKKKK